MMDGNDRSEEPSAPSDLEKLRQEFGDRWEFTAVWWSAASGPDWRQVFAVRAEGGKTLSAHTAADMAATIRRAEEGS
jgi:hypothetical protein